MGTIVARVLVLAFCLMTALYAFIASSAFAYLQFIKPRVFHWVGTFSDTHAMAAWLWLVLLCVVLWPHLRGRTLAVRAARGLAAFAAGAVVLNTLAPVIPSLHEGTRSVAVGAAALLPIVWLALVDHLAAWSFLRAQSAASDETGRRRQEGRVFMACMGAAALLTAGYAVLASVSIGRTFEPDLLSAGLALGVGASLLGHLLVFSAAFIVVAVASRLGGRSILLQYLLLLGAAVLLVAGLFSRFVGDSVGLSNAPAKVAALAMGVAIASAWGGMRLRAHAGVERRLTSGLDVLVGPPADVSGTRFAVALAAVLPLAWVAGLLASATDWDFALLKSGVAIVWVLTFMLVYRAAPLRDVPSIAVMVACAFPLAAHAAWHPGEAQRHTLGRYAVHNASYLLADDLLRERAQGAAIGRYLRANTGLTDVAVKPVSIDFVPSLAPVPPPQRPHVFLLVIDSLRSDYLSPYNPQVHFTPHIASFAARNLFFPNAFTKYGGTGMSMPAIWAGSALAHKQYVLPFDSMNALQKLVDVNGYQRVQSRDHITSALWTPTDRIELEQGKDEMDMEFCGTIDELGRRLDAGAASNGPVFAQTRSLTLHIAAVRKAAVPADRDYAGFNRSYAYAVEQIDACFGSFIERLERLKLYDHSVVVLTADHGEIIGEDGRWGHSYHMFPQVIQVPLFMHLPSALEHARVDPGAVAMSTDITPTLYSILGYPVTAVERARWSVAASRFSRRCGRADAATATCYRRATVRSMRSCRGMVVISTLWMRCRTGSMPTNGPRSAISTGPKCRSPARRQHWDNSESGDTSTPSHVPTALTGRSERMTHR